MGKFNSKYDLVLIKELQEELKCDELEIKQWYKSYSKSFPSGKINEVNFILIFQKFFPQGEVNEFAKHVFRAFGGKAKGSLGFKEFYKALRIHSHGTLEDKISFAFKLYDVDGDGIITREEVLSVVLSIYKVFGKSSKNSCLGTPERRTQLLFRKMDVNNDGIVTLNEFKQGAHHDSLIIHMLGGGSC